MKRTLTATVAALSIITAPAYTQVPGIDTTTTAETDASIDIAPPSMETGAEIVIEGEPRPDDALSVEAQGDADLQTPETDMDTDIDLDSSLPVRPTVDTDLKSEFEPEPELDIDSALGLKITDR